MIANAFILVAALVLSGALLCDFLELLPKRKPAGKPYFDMDGKEWVKLQPA